MWPLSRRREKITGVHRIEEWNVFIVHCFNKQLSSAVHRIRKWSKPGDSGGDGRGMQWRPVSASLPKAVSSVTVPVVRCFFLIFKIVGRSFLICQAFCLLIYWFCAHLYGNFREGQNCCACSALKSVQSEFVVVLLCHLSLHEIFVIT